MDAFFSFLPLLSHLLVGFFKEVTVTEIFRIHPEYQDTVKYCIVKLINFWRILPADDKKAYGDDDFLTLAAVRNNINHKFEISISSEGDINNCDIDFEDLLKATKIILDADLGRLDRKIKRREKLLEALPKVEATASIFVP
jgi:hypothetical protein